MLFKSFFMVSHFLYKLYSKSSTRYYVGETRNIEERIFKHNQHFYSSSFTKIANDWELVLLDHCLDRTQALFLEKFIKKMKSKIFIQKIISNPEILNEIISKNLT